MMKRLWWSLVCVLALGLAVGCDDDDPGTDDAGTSGDASVDPRDGGMEPAPDVMAVEGDDLVEADLSCLGTRTEPSGSEEATFTVRAVDFQQNFAVEGLRVQFYPDNAPTLDGSCEAPCQEVTTDAAGEATVTGIAGTWYAYRIIAGTGKNVSTGQEEEFLEGVQVNQVTPEDGGEAILNVVRTATRDLIIGVLGTSVEEGTAVVVGRAADCMDRNLTEANVRIFDANGEIETSISGSPREFYFNGSNQPAARGKRTREDGLYGTANIPSPADNMLRVEIWGSVDGTPQMIGCERVQVGPDVLTIINIGPKRADGPSDCSM